MNQGAPITLTDEQRIELERRVRSQSLGCAQRRACADSVAGGQRYPIPIPLSEPTGHVVRTEPFPTKIPW